MFFAAVAGGHFARDLAHDRGQLPFEIAHACFGGVVADRVQDGLVADRQLRCDESVVLQQLRDQMLLRDLQLFVFGVAGKTNHFHAIAQRARDVVDHVRRGNEERVRKIVRNLEIAIDESVILLWIQYFEQRRGGIPAEVFPDLVDLVDHDQRVVHAHLDVALDQLSRHRADVRLSMSANLRFVGHASDSHANELASESVGNRCAERRFADAGRSGEAEDRSFQIAFELQDGQKLEDALFHFLQSVMSRLETLFSFGEVESIFGFLRPWDLEDCVEMTFDDGVVG